MAFETPGDSGRLPYRSVYGKPNLALLCERVGLDSRYASNEYLVKNGIFACFELFSDGELQVLIKDPTQPNSTDPTRTAAERHGEFYVGLSRLREEAKKDPELADEVNKFARFCGSVLAEFVLSGRVNLPAVSQVMPTIDPYTSRLELRIGDYTWRANRGLSTVLEYGPGLVGRRFVDLQIEAMARHSWPPIRYLSVSDGPFVSQFLSTYLDRKSSRKLGVSIYDTLVDSQVFRSLENGMAQGAATILDIPEAHEALDVVIICGVQSANYSELQAAIAGTPHLLQKGGKLILSAPIEVLDREVSYAAQQQMAEATGLELEYEVFRDSGSVRLGTDTISGLAVFSK